MLLILIKIKKNILSIKIETLYFLDKDDRESLVIFLGKCHSAFTRTLR